MGSETRSYIETTENEFCDNCRHLVKLKHNFGRYKGFEESYCCTVLANEKDGFVLEVAKMDRCELFEVKGGGSDGSSTKVL